MSVVDVTGVDRTVPPLVARDSANGGLTRRGWLMGAAAIAGAAAWPRPGAAQTADAASPVDLTVQRRTIEVNGRAAPVFGIMQKNGKAGLELSRDERFRVRLHNELDVPTLVHWHGLTPPYQQDGVPELSQPALKPGEIAAYDFALARAGTNWMHSHVGLQEQLLLAAPLIVRDPADAGRDEQEVVILLHDFSFRSPEEIMAGLARAGAYGMAMDSRHSGMSTMGMTMSMPSGPVHGQGAAAPHGSGPHDMGAPGTSSAQNHSAMSEDLNDVDYDAYLANDRTLADPEVVRVERGGRVRLRIINGSAATGFFIDLGNLDGEVIAVDGMPILPIKGRWLELATAQRIDVRLVLPAEEGAFPVLAQREGDVARTGLILATRKANVERIAEASGRKAAAIGFGLEQRLRSPERVAADGPLRRLTLDLTGSMSPYLWSLNGRRFGDHEALRVREGERVEIEMRNKTPMSHPMHLHGHHFQVISLNGQSFDGAMRDTVLVPANASVTVAFKADNPGRWGLHCHNLYHMFAGMMTELRYVS